MQGQQHRRGIWAEMLRMSRSLPEALCQSMLCNNTRGIMPGVCQRYVHNRSEPLPEGQRIGRYLKKELIYTMLRGPGC